MANQVEVSIKVNGVDSKAEIEPRMLLVHFLREELNLTGTHIGCDTSQCGACTVLLDGDPVKSCTVLAVQANGKSITTVEGLANQEELHPIQQSFWEKHGLQCGFCTPGVMIAAVGLLGENPDPSEEEIRDALEGVICRCTGYQFIVDAIKHAAQIMAGEEKVAMADSLKVEEVR
ncbi:MULTISPECIES: (2Fe-2S)-binding protein [Brevibacillus]|uniref:(2Fe-2S)-binding protein n=1 Tax=Brevibacillus invocatus TaxID=173959 RepID=A0A3M8CHE1_9BACL|nr:MULTISPECIES: (2Fe-2S)-binding protein [Brevibacillus]MCM3081589.1 (2Fe-2S)-binding protein [Brevibacillus invocatus]MCM3431964.1 (2Fe-2S)-binding protein [Brevibacillus invocatus]MDH4617931.1 (2Fe-2S)-binding protein [Brevibacillus sp. AY1]RNB75174.1 (2Fe-2S)-binding protein [Brevibacillus invocatus]